jgi:hypothetical protein
MFGGYDRSKFTGTIKWHDLKKPYFFYAVQLDDILYNGKSLGVCNKERKCLFTPDSGTSLMASPTWAYDAIIEALPLVEGCTSKYGLGVLTFVLDGVHYPL